MRIALTNVVQHAEAHRADVQVVAADGDVLIAVVDDGNGCDPVEACVVPGIGVHTVLKRARELHGHATLITAPGKGMEVRAWLPVTSTTGQCLLSMTRDVTR